MSTSEMIRALCEKEKISVAELARRVGQTPQNFGKKLKRDTFTLNEINAIAEAVGAVYSQKFTFNDGSKIDSIERTFY